ncbi:cobyrinic acid a,c-diamide synthase, partial [candidate division KSB1 bacterium]
MVTNPEPYAIADASAIVKIMTYFYPKHPISLIVNMENSEAEAKETFEKFNLITQKFLQRSL